MIVYVSGPMTGYVDYNRDAFDRATKFLREQGHIVVNPAEYDGGLTDEELAKIPHHEFLRRDVRLLLDCTHIYLLPGWAHSKGATLEATVADGCGVERFRVPGDLDIWRTFEGEPETEATEASESCGCEDRACPHEPLIEARDFDTRDLRFTAYGVEVPDGGRTLADTLGGIDVRVAKDCPVDGCTLTAGVSHIHAREAF